MNTPTPIKQTTDDPRWAAVLARDSAQNGKFYYSVATTGIYCKPSCGARLPRVHNVAFHESCMAAEQAGFRPCKRCKPDQVDQAQQHTNIVAQACRFITDAETEPTLDEIAQHVGISAYHFHRLFKSITGVTPKAYAKAHRLTRVRNELRKSATITDAIYDAGFASNSQFYTQSNQNLGMTATQYRQGGADTIIHFALGQCTLGAILVARSTRGICTIALDDTPEQLLQALQDQFPHAELIGAEADFEQQIARVIAFVDTPQIGLDLPLDIRGTAFQQRVWQALRAIPVGETVSYSELAQRIGSPQSTRAVANACSANTLAVAIPCHRVVRQNGDLSGYRWGIERKQKLLAAEHQT